MRTTGTWVIVLAAMSFAFAGCGDSSKKDSAKNSKKESSKEGQRHEGKHEGHSHSSKGPHNGAIIELGNDDYHAELVHDEDTNTVKIYILDGSAKKEIAIAADSVTLNLVVDKKPIQYKLAAKSGEGDPRGQASRFELVDEMLSNALHDEKTSGRLNVTIKDKPYVGKIEHHDHHDHDHKDGDHDHEGHDHDDKDHDHKD